MTYWLPEWRFDFDSFTGGHYDQLWLINSWTINDQLADWLTNRQCDWLTDSVTDWPTIWPADLLNRMAYLPNDLLIDLPAYY